MSIGLRVPKARLRPPRRRFGYRRIHVMLERQGIVMNQKKLRRLYREEKLQVRRRSAATAFIASRNGPSSGRMPV
jgi:putative transposase